MSDNALGMSDEEFANAPIPEDPPEAVEEPVEASEEETDTDVAEEATEAPEEPEEASEATEVEEDTDSEETTEEEEDNGLQEGQEETNEVEDKAEEVETDYKSFYEAITSPFKANGKDMQISSIEDARQLMQMGANYNKKMASLKPHLKMVKALEKANIDQDKLNYLLDLSNKNPDAIKQLLKDSELDPLDIDTNESINYKPNNYSVSDKEVELDGILEEIQDTESFNRTIDVIGNKWDENSKQVLINDPQIIKVINDHVGNGIYDQIMGVVEKERMLGKLSGLSDIEAYRTVGDALNAQGAFNKPTMSTEPQSIKATNKVDPKLAARKKAASPTKSKTTVKKESDFNPLSMSDEEFEKQIMGKFI